MKSSPLPAIIVVSIFGVIAAAVLWVSFSSTFVNYASANPSGTLSTSTAPFNSATSSAVYIVAGTATTTTTFDSQADGGALADTAHLLLMMTGSSTSSILNVSFEYSDDNLNWFSDFTNFAATTSLSVNLNLPKSYVWQYASSSPNLIGGVAIGSTTSIPITRVFFVPTPTRYVRAILTVPGLPTTVGQSQVWARWAAKRENR